MAETNDISLPTSDQIERELEHEKNKRGLTRSVRRIICLLIVVAAAAVLLLTFVIPVMRICGASMSPTLEDGDIVVAIKNVSIDESDLVAFYFNNEILVKRVIAGPESRVDIDENGNVFVNSERLSEPYLTESVTDYTGGELTCAVPDGRYFVMGDNRKTSVDSRNSEIGCISEDQIIGKVVLSVWPLNRLGTVE